jgi:hypothetical protein
MPCWKTNALALCLGRVGLSLLPPLKLPLARRIKVGGP